MKLLLMRPLTDLKKNGGYSQSLMLRLLEMNSTVLLTSQGKKWHELGWIGGIMLTPILE